MCQEYCWLAVTKCLKRSAETETEGLSCAFVPRANVNLLFTPTLQAPELLGKALKPALRCHSSIKLTAARRCVHCQALSLEDRWQCAACWEAAGKLKAAGEEYFDTLAQQSDIPRGIHLKGRSTFHWPAARPFPPARGGIISSPLAA